MLMLNYYGSNFVRIVEPDYRTGHTCTGIMWLCDTSMVSLVKPSVTKIQGIKKSQECCVKLPKRKNKKTYITATANALLEHGYVEVDKGEIS